MTVFYEVRCQGAFLSFGKILANITYKTIELKQMGGKCLHKIE